jgi:hypothetical protein
MHYKYVSIEVSSEVMEQALIQIRDVVKEDPEECEVNDTEIELAPKLASLCILYLHEFAEAQEQGKVVMDSIWLPKYDLRLLVATAAKLLMAPETEPTEEKEGE